MPLFSSLMSSASLVDVELHKLGEETDHYPCSLILKTIMSIYMYNYLFVLWLSLSEGHVAKFLSEDSQQHALLGGLLDVLPIK